MNIKSETIDVIYNVPLGYAKWEDVISTIKIEFDATIGFMLIDKPNEPPLVISTVPADDPFWISYGTYYYGIDPWNILFAKRVIPINTCAAGCEHMPAKEFYKTEYFNDLWKPNGLYYTGGGYLMTRNNIGIVFGFPRDKNVGTYTDEEIRCLTDYAQNVVRAVELDGVLGDSLPRHIYEEALATSFGLTSAESRLVHQLFRSGSLPKASEKLNRSYHTVRNQLKSVLKKTETSSQIELFKRIVTKHKI